MTNVAHWSYAIYTTSRAVYPERNDSSIMTLSILMRRVVTQKQNDPIDDALRGRHVCVAARGNSWPLA